MRVITFSNGHRFQYVAASGALGYDGRGWLHERMLAAVGLVDPGAFTVVTKTFTRYPTRGNLSWWHPWSCIRPIKEGWANAVKLTNPGIDWFYGTVVRRLNQPEKYPLVLSLYGTPDELAYMVKRTRGLPLKAIEVNGSCPSTGLDANAQSERLIAGCRMVREISELPIIAKVAVHHDIGGITSALEDVVEAYAINSVPWSVLFPDRPTPFARFSECGVSGRAAQAATWELMRKIVLLTCVPVIAPSIWEYEDIARARIWGAGAVSFGSLFLRNCLRPTQYVRRDMAETPAARF